MKLIFTILTLCSINAAADAAENEAQMIRPVELADQDRAQMDPPVSIMHYLSDTEFKDLLMKMAPYELKRLQKEGRLGNDGIRQDRRLTFSIMRPADEEDASISATGGFSYGGVAVGRVVCNINAHYPHKGSGPNDSVVVKAKSSGSCYYEHLNSSYPPPPTIAWRLAMTLTRPASIPWADFWMASHDRNGLSEGWSASSAQVFSNGCVNDEYMHINVMILAVPLPWTTSGLPIWLDGSQNEVTNC